MKMAVLGEDVVADEPPCCCAHEHVRREVLLAEDACCTYARGDGIDSDLHPLRGILAGNYCRHGPCEYAVGGRKRTARAVAGGKEIACGIVRKRTLAAKDNLRYLFHHYAIYESFAAE